MPRIIFFTMNPEVAELSQTDFRACADNIHIDIGLAAGGLF